MERGETAAREEGVPQATASLLRNELSSGIEVQAQERVGRVGPKKGDYLVKQIVQQRWSRRLDAVWSKTSGDRREAGEPTGAGDLRSEGVARGGARWRDLRQGTVLPAMRGQSSEVRGRGAYWAAGG
uniref:Uncharacterized protein n=1 Tax=Oryza nivara TaxID=4536 RepID=A0A0E0IU54_ORYNI